MNFIINPNNNKTIYLYSQKGKQLLKQYIQSYNYLKSGGELEKTIKIEKDNIEQDNIEQDKNLEQENS